MAELAPPTPLYPAAVANLTEISNKAASLAAGEVRHTGEHVDVPQTFPRRIRER